MAKAASGNSSSRQRVADMRGATRLLTQATISVSHVAEGLHQSILDRLGIAGTAAGQTAGVTGFVYKSIRAVTHVLGMSTEGALAVLESYFDSSEDGAHGSSRREVVLAALNGVMGDRLVADKNPLVIQMSLRYRGEALNWNALPLPFAPEHTGRVLLMIHGLCRSDLQWEAEHNGQPVNHARVLAETLGYTPIYLRYNSGLHTSQNGRELAAQLEQLLEHWPAAITEISVLAHSMGGLIIRSALHYARAEGLNWPKVLKNIVFLGTPHHGAPLERAGNILDALLGSTRFTAPFARLGKLRSAGITDLRYGHLLDEDWQGSDRFHRRPDGRRCVALPEDVACFTVAATTAARRSILADRLIGDGLVPLHSALGVHRDAQRKLDFPKSSQWIAYRTSHMALLSHPDVTGQLLKWLKGNGQKVT